jgi:hypothetical protein
LRVHSGKGNAGAPDDRNRVLLSARAASQLDEWVAIETACQRLGPLMPHPPRYHALVRLKSWRLHQK